MKPNIFKCAAVEFERNEILCWMLEWANTEDKYLNRFACELIESVLDLNRYEAVNVDNLVGIKLKKQYKNMDILMYLTFDQDMILPVIIEGKTYTEEYPAELRRYHRLVVEENKEKDNILSPLKIYYKSGIICEEEICEIENEGYRVFRHSRMIKLMKKYLQWIDNDIFMDYYSYLRGIELREERNIIEKKIRVN